MNLVTKGRDQNHKIIMESCIFAISQKQSKLHDCQKIYRALYRSKVDEVLVKKNIEETQIVSEMELKGKWRNRENSFL
jgi:hypothetical protein